MGNNIHNQFAWTATADQCLWLIIMLQTYPVLYSFYTFLTIYILFRLE